MPSFESIHLPKIGAKKMIQKCTFPCKKKRKMVKLNKQKYQVNNGKKGPHTTTLRAHY